MSVRRGGDPSSEADESPGARSGVIDTDVAGEKRLTVMRPGALIPEPPASEDVAAMDLAAVEQLDAFREVRTRLLALAAAKGNAHFTTLIVGMTGTSGASFVARNLAASFTLQEGRMAMLVDCNLRHPTQHRLLGVRVEEGGLFDYLDQPYAAVERLAHPTPIPGLHLIPAGKPSDRPREYFSSQHMKLLLAALRQAPCYVFLDGPPVKGSPDARILAELVDFVVLVVGYASATPEEISAAAKQFDPKKFAGVVFNDHA